MSEEARKKLTQDYLDGGVSSVQTAELGFARPSIEDFLTFSRKYEGAPYLALWHFGGIEFVFSYLTDFERHGISGQSLAGCMDGDQNAIREVSRRILQEISRSQALSDQGFTQLVSRGDAISQAAIRAFILATLDAMERYQKFEPIPEFLFLLSRVLFPGNPEAPAAQKSLQLKVSCEFLANAYYRKHGRIPSFRWLAKRTNVAPSTISRLYKDPLDFEHAVRRLMDFANPYSEPEWENLLND